MKILVQRNLHDYEAWKKMVTEMDGVREAYGSRGVEVFRSANDPNEVFLVFDWADDLSFKKYFDRSDVQEALASSGTTQIIEVGESFRLPY